MRWNVKNATEPTQLWFGRDLHWWQRPSRSNNCHNVHRVLDPLWKLGETRRSDLYAEMAKRLGVKELHTAWLNDELEARIVFRTARAIEKEIVGA